MLLMCMHALLGLAKLWEEGQASEALSSMCTCGVTLCTESGTNAMGTTTPPPAQLWKCKQPQRGCWTGVCRKNLVQGSRGMCAKQTEVQCNVGTLRLSRGLYKEISHRPRNAAATCHMKGPVPESCKMHQTEKHKLSSNEHTIIGGRGTICTALGADVRGESIG